MAVAVLTYYFFAQVTELSGFGGVNNVARPAIVSNPVTDPQKLFYIALVASAAVYVSSATLRARRSASRSRRPRHPSRMRALGYNVPLLRMLAFGLGALIASFSGDSSVWWNTASRRLDRPHAHDRRAGDRG